MRASFALAAGVPPLSRTGVGAALGDPVLVVRARVEQYFGPDGVAQSDMLREPNVATFAELFKTAVIDWKIP